MKYSPNHYFNAPSYLNMNACSFDISDESIKYGQLKANPMGFKFIKYGREKIPEGLLSGGVIQDERKFSKFLKNFRKREKLKFIRVSLPEPLIYIFTLSLPQMQGQDLREIILLQIEEHIPLKANEVVFDYDTIKENKESTIVGVTAVSLEVIQSYLSVFKEAGLKPLSFESEAQAIARSVLPFEDKGSVMIVDFGYIRTGISIAYNGSVLLTTTLDLGGYNLTEMLAKNFNVSIEKAEKIKRTYNLDNELDAKEIFPVLLNGVSVLRDELNKQYVYWRTHNEESGLTHEKINRIILSGGNANLGGVADYLEASMKIPVERANTWINIFDMKSFVPEMSFQDSLSYATVIGLGLHGFMNETKSVINILPLREKKRLRRKYWARLVSVFLGFLILIEIFLMLLLLPSYFLASSKSNIALYKLGTFTAKNPEIKTVDLNKTIKSINNKVSFLVKQNLKPQTMEKIFSWLLDNRPSGITFNQILFNQKEDGTSTLNVAGVAKNRSVLSNFKTLLNDNPDYKTVNLPISDFIDPTDIHFNISIVLK